MSTLLALKVDNVVVLATDSRACNDRSKHVVSDSEAKIFEPIPGVFYAYSGYSSLAATQVRIATALGRFAHTKTLSTLANELDAASMPHIEQLVEYLVSGRFQDSVSGSIPFHSYILCGVSQGVAGFLSRQFWIRNGKICRDDTDNFSPVSAGWITPGELVAEIVNIPDTWAHGAIASAGRLVDHLRQVTPFVGGPTQMVRITNAGAQWIHQPIRKTSGSNCEVAGKVAANLGGGLQINPTTKAIEAANLDIGKFASSVRPVALFSSDPALPDANYPTGTYGFNITSKTFKRVNDVGNAWVLAVHGGKDIQAGTISADRLIVSDVTAAVIAAGVVSTSYLTANYTTTTALAANYATISYLSANYATISYLSANYITASAISATYATISALNAKTITADKITGGTCAATVSFTAPTITVTSGSTTINIDATNKIKVSDSSGGFVARLDNFGLAVSATGSPSCAVTTSGFSVNSGSGISSLNDGALFMQNLQVLRTRQAGPGVPSFSSFADVQTWCQNLYNALKAGSGHGLLT
jgi:hypothetical protein